MKHKLQSYVKQWASFTPTEIAFILATLFISWGFIHFDVKTVYFAKLGIPLKLPELLGGITFTKQAIYVTELYILFLIVLLLKFPLKAWGSLKETFQQKKKILLPLLSVFICFGMIRALVGAEENPLLMVRNACFIWYLSVPIIIFLLSIRAQVIEFLFWHIHMLAFVYFFSNLAQQLHFPLSTLIDHAPILYWIPFLGMVGAVALALSTRNWWLYFFISLPLSFALAFSYFLGFQRTVLVGIVGTALFFVLYPKTYKLALKRLVIFAALFACSIWIQDNREIRGSSYSSNPLVKSPVDSKGLEIFRKQMWQDAWGLFLEHPFVGIGFQKQVVYRTSQGDSFVPNDKYAFLNEEGAPIAGPHNSYLNALARLGLFALLLPLIHFLAACFLWEGRYWAALTALIGQVLYAFFNVGLESPGRSFFLLLCIGLALKQAYGPKRPTNPLP